MLMHTVANALTCNGKFPASYDYMRCCHFQDFPCVFTQGLQWYTLLMCCNCTAKINNVTPAACSTWILVAINNFRLKLQACSGQAAEERYKLYRRVPDRFNLVGGFQAQSYLRHKSMHRFMSAHHPLTPTSMIRTAEGAHRYEEEDWPTSQPTIQPINDERLANDLIAIIMKW